MELSKTDNVPVTVNGRCVGTASLRYQGTRIVGDVYFAPGEIEEIQRTTRVTMLGGMALVERLGEDGK